MAALLLLRCTGCETNKDCTAPATHVALTGSNKARCDQCHGVAKARNAQKYRSNVKKDGEKQRLAEAVGVARANLKAAMWCSSVPAHITTGRMAWDAPRVSEGAAFIQLLRDLVTNRGASVQKYFDNQSIVTIGGGGFEFAYKAVLGGTAADQLAMWKTDTEQAVAAGRTPIYLHQLYKLTGDSKRLAVYFAEFVSESTNIALAQAPERLGPATWAVIVWYGILLRGGPQIYHLDTLGHHRDQVGAFMSSTHGTTWVGKTTSSWTPSTVAIEIGFTASQVHTMDGPVGILLREYSSCSALLATRAEITAASVTPMVAPGDVTLMAGSVVHRGMGGDSAVSFGIMHGVDNPVMGGVDQARPRTFPCTPLHHAMSLLCLYVTSACRYVWLLADLSGSCRAVLRHLRLDRRDACGVARSSGRGCHRLEG